MAADWKVAIPNLDMALYDGTNGASIVAGLNGSVFISDTGSVLTFTDHNFTTQTVLSGRYVVRGVGQYGGIITAAQFAPNSGEYRNLTDFVKGLIPATIVTKLQQHGNASGLVSVPASLGGQTQNYDVTITPSIPADQLATVRPDAWLRGAPNIISGHCITQIPTVVNATTVRVRVQSGAASLAGTGIEVNFTSLITS